VRSFSSFILFFFFSPPSFFYSPFSRSVRIGGKKKGADFFFSFSPISSGQGRDKCYLDEDPLFFFFFFPSSFSFTLSFFPTTRVRVDEKKYGIDFLSFSLLTSPLASKALHDGVEAGATEPIPPHFSLLSFFSPSISPPLPSKTFPPPTGVESTEVERGSFFPPSLLLFSLFSSFCRAVHEERGNRIRAALFFFSFFSPSSPLITLVRNALTGERKS